MAAKPQTIKALKARLLSLRSELKATADTGDQAAATVELDQTKVGRLSRMDAMQAQAMSQASNQRRELQLNKIEAALERIEQGSYGRCFDCDESIAIRRLEFDPAATLCLACAEQREV